MATVSAYYSSRTASTSLLRAFRYQSQASTLRNLSFFNSGDPSDSVDFSRTAREGSMMMSLIQGGNRSLFGGLYANAEAFNLSMMNSVAATIGLQSDSSTSLLGQMINYNA